jgi:nitrous oxide reductase accessory protein NosL
MKKIVITLMTLVLAAGAAQNADMPSPSKQKKARMMPVRYQSVPMTKVQLLQKGDAKLYCPECGMNLPMFYRTNHAADVDGKTEQFCSMHCLVEAMHHDTGASNIRVVDNTSLKFIPAAKAFYVVGSRKPGTMSPVSKYAFATRKDAETFAHLNGGEVKTFEEALAMARASFEKESRMIRKKQHMMSQKGAGIFQKKCQPVDRKFSSVAEAKSYVSAHGLCKKLSGKELQMVGLYLLHR